LTTDTRAGQEVLNDLLGVSHVVSVRRVTI